MALVALSHEGRGKKSVYGALQSTSIGGLACPRARPEELADPGWMAGSEAGHGEKL